jgi:hypothetical protein
VWHYPDQPLVLFIVWGANELGSLRWWFRRQDAAERLYRDVLETGPNGVIVASRDDIPTAHELYPEREPLICSLKFIVSPDWTERKRECEQLEHVSSTLQ